MVAQVSIRPRVDAIRQRIDLTSFRAGIAVVAAAITLWATITGAAAWSQGFSPLRSSTWGRWDTYNYLTIADSGYSLYRCGDTSWGHFPNDWCGNTGWSPGYPAAIRLLRFDGWSDQTNGWLLALAALAAVLTLSWFAFLRHLPATQGLTGMALAATFPSSVYFGAVFPVSLAVLSAMAMLAAIRRQRWLLAGLAGTIATVVYPSGLLVGAAALAPLLSPSLGALRRRCLAALHVGGPIATAYLLVLAQYQWRVGHWNAWFLNQANNHYPRVLPTTTLWRAWNDVVHRTAPWVGAQALLTAVLVVFAVLLAARHRRSLTTVEWAALAVSVALWLLPLTIGGGFSHHRAEALVFPVVLLTARWRPWVTAALAAVAAVIAFNMAQLFFIAALV